MLFIVSLSINKKICLQRRKWQRPGILLVKCSSLFTGNFITNNEKGYVNLVFIQTATAY